MAKKKAAKTTVIQPLKYKQMTVEIGFTDGGIKTVTYYSLSDCFRDIERIVGEHYANSVRIELF